MDETQALEALGALSHSTRLSAFRLLVVAGRDGMTAGVIARRLGVLQNTLSTHLSLLARAGLVTARREGRTIRYTADFTAMQALMGFLVRDCCAGRPEICASLLALAERGGECDSPAAPG